MAQQGQPVPAQVFVPLQGQAMLDAMHQELKERAEVTGQPIQDVYSAAAELRERSYPVDVTGHGWGWASRVQSSP